MFLRYNWTLSGSVNVSCKLKTLNGNPGIIIVRSPDWPPRLFWRRPIPALAMQVLCTTCSNNDEAHRVVPLGVRAIHRMVFSGGSCGGTDHSCYTGYGHKLPFPDNWRTAGVPHIRTFLSCYHARLSAKRGCFLQIQPWIWFLLRLNCYGRRLIKFWAVCSTIILKVTGSAELLSHA